jgi:hypothetical protein
MPLREHTSPGNAGLRPPDHEARPPTVNIGRMARLSGQSLTTGHRAVVPLDDGVRDIVLGPSRRGYPGGVVGCRPVR